MSIKRNLVSVMTPEAKVTRVKPFANQIETVSGLPWMPNCPAHWKVVRPKTIFRRMQRPVRPEDGVVTAFRDGTVTLRANRRTSGFTEALQEIGYQGIRKGDLVIHAMDAFAGAIGVSDSDGKGTPVYSVCQPTGEANSWYYALVLREMSRSGYLLSLAKGIRERSSDFRFADFASLMVPLPPVEEQEQIVRFVRQLDLRVNRLIKAKRRLIELLNEQKQAIIHQAVTRGLDPTVPLKPSGIEWLGDIPEHWKVMLNQRIFREITRSYEGTDEIQLSLSQRDGLLPTSRMQERSLQTATYDNWKITLPGDLVLNRFKAHLGVFFAATLRGIVTFHYGVFRAKLPVDMKYYEHLCHTNAYRAVYGGRSNGMTVGLQNLSNQNFYNVRSPYPPVQEQRAIVEFIDQETKELSKAILAAQSEIDLIREYRIRLVADVVTGQLDVRRHPWANTACADLDIAFEPGDTEEDGDDMEVAEEEE